MRNIMVLGALLALVIFLVSSKKGNVMYLTSANFKHNGLIPAQYTCEGAGLSPALEWDNVPQGTKSFVLIVDDPDAPDPRARQENPWVHWVIFNMPPSKRALQEDENIPEEQSGLNDEKEIKYMGPCPPIGKHRYVFTLYAVDQILALQSGASKNDVEQAMKGHVLASAQLIGLYEKQKNK